MRRKSGVGITDCPDMNSAVNHQRKQEIKQGVCLSTPKKLAFYIIEVLQKNSHNRKVHIRFKLNQIAINV